MECLTINYSSQSKKYFYLQKTPWIKNTRIVREAPDPHMGPAGNSPSNFPIHGALGAWRARAGPVQRPGGPGPEAGDPMRGARQGLRDSEFRLSWGGPRAQARRNRTGHEQGLMQDTRRCQGPPSFKTRVTCFPAAWSHVSPDRPKVCHAPRKAW